MSKDWHSGHFCCWQCDESLTGQRYVLRDDHPYCIKCYESVFANTCDECNKTIGIDSKDLSYKDKHWHEACFFCNKCRVSLVDKQFGSKADKIYCGNCYDAQFASRCDGCGQIFRADNGRKAAGKSSKSFFCLVKSAAGKLCFTPFSGFRLTDRPSEHAGFLEFQNTQLPKYCFVVFSTQLFTGHKINETNSCFIALTAMLTSIIKPNKSLVGRMYLAPIYDRTRLGQGELSGLGL
ncbi:unnamed protein product [Nesidiocoris tenuis]|uniref:LIM zinc-binding domain-containing protein n=1 Tax=Nesidiocoris tenuis TaxID=355587 RepID=A0A6H5H084_9HEMI|nr:unnamed protein product [Nesidiocoris tenuis]